MKREAAQLATIADELPFALVDVEGYGGLSFDGDRELLRRAGWNRAVAQNQLLHRTAERLDPEGQRDDVEEQQ